MKPWQRRILGILAVGGGSLGTGISVIALIRATRVIEWLTYIVFSCLYAWGVWCGVKLLEGQPDAEMHNRRFWLIQVPAFSSPLVGYSMFCGFHATLSLDLTPLGFNANFHAGSQFNLSLLQWEQPLSLGVNVFALGIFLWMARQFPDARSTEVQSPP
jgi:hypothetical protein